MTRPYKGICSVDGCGREIVCRSVCSRHYYRITKHGSVTGGGRSHAAKGELQRWLDEVATEYDSDDCLIWPYTRNDMGYGQIKTENGMEYVHRILCERKNGPVVEPRIIAAHSCGNGHLGCVNMRHLVWKTHKENSADMFEHGTIARGEMHGGSKLTEANIREIRRIAGPTRLCDMAAIFGVAPSTIRAVLTGKTWGWLD